MSEMENGWKLGKDGFVMEYMVAGPALEEFETELRDEDQLRLEGRLRKAISEPRAESLELEVRLGEKAPNGCTWQVYAPYGNGIIDVSAFYSTLQKIRIWAAAELSAPEEMTVQGRVWTYMSVGIYVNGKLAGQVDYPDYKPIQHCDLELHLQKGRNQILFVCDNLGARDTRNILGLQILGLMDGQGCQESGAEADGLGCPACTAGLDGLRTGLADASCEERTGSIRSFLDGLTLEGSLVKFPEEAPKGACYMESRESPDYEVMRQPAVWKSLEGQKELVIPHKVMGVEICVKQDGVSLSRRLEAASHKKLLLRPEGCSREEAWKATLESIASVSSLNRGGFGFAIFNVLARKYLGREEARDRDYLFETLELINRRVDCSDFIVCGFLRYMHSYSLDEELQKRAKEVLLDFRYWMNMEGTDAMCFWSENHALMFYAAAMDAGKMYPDEYFPRAKMTGRELCLYSEDKLRQWLTDVEEYGYEEFLSAVYMCVTLGALLHVIDYACEDISRRARGAADLLLTQMSRHVFKGVMMAPMGRVYRDVIYPFGQGSQSMVNLVDPSAPISYGEGWLAFLAGSSYRFPEGLKELMEEETDCAYTSGNALIRLEKTDAYCLTSVESPRQDEYVRWHNDRIAGDWTDSDTHQFTKSLNECFHGTSCFQPGTYGYQQHMWYAALSPEAVIFVNHPGTWSEQSSMRPGYWFGNGVMPAIRQEKGILGAVYQITEEHPVSFTHVYCPAERFDTVQKDGQWLFMEKDGGYLALWSAGEMEPWNDMIFGCEYRVYSRNTAWLCICGSRKDYPTLHEFTDYARSRRPVYSPEEGKLTAEGGFQVICQTVQDPTQFVE